MASDAVALDRISRVVGYKLKKGNFRQTSPNLPQRIAIIGEANEANQSGLNTDPFECKTLKEAGERYGYGSPLYLMMRILRPQSGDGVAGIPTIIYPQAKAVSAAQKVITVESSGVATGNGTHTLRIAGRDNVDGSNYDINVVTGDNAATIAQKLEDAINAVLGSPVLGTSNDYRATFTSKWAGLTANDLTITVDTNGQDLGLIYIVNVTAAGSGTPTNIAAALQLFADNWVTIVVNGYGLVTSVMNALETFNGIPDPANPTGRFTGTVMKPFIAISGSTASDPSSITDTRLNNVTIAVAPAPLSGGFPFEAAANMAALFGPISENTPHLDAGGRSYPDMPVPVNQIIGVMADYNQRDAIVKKGCSTVALIAGVYQVQDFVTTYHPVGEVPPQYRYARNLMLDYNVRFSYYLLEQIHVVGKVMSLNDENVGVDGVIKPKQWKQIVSGMAVDLRERALIVDSDFTAKSVTVDISSINPDRLETFFRYKRSGVARIASTDAEAGFNFGTLINQ